MKMQIEYKNTLSRQFVFIDTRSPGEFEADHVPGAVSLPIFSNDERALIGTIYKQVNPELAIDKGKKIFDAKIDFIRSGLLKFKGRKIVIYCWRGGMRSKVITELALDLGLDAKQLKGGYKSYRKYVREKLHNLDFQPKLLVMHGLTGSGKTDLLLNFKDMVDLECMAQHRSSVFGSIGLKPRTQKMFETSLFEKLKALNNKTFVLVEGESRKIGDLFIPDNFFRCMKKGINISVTCRIESRVKRLVEIYTSNKTDVEKTKRLTLGLKQKLGKQKTEEMVQMLDSGKIEDFMKEILLCYYDPLYRYSISNLNYDIIVDTDDMTTAVKNLKDRYNIE